MPMVGNPFEEKWCFVANRCDREDAHTEYSSLLVCDSGAVNQRKAQVILQTNGQLGCFYLLTKAKSILTYRCAVVEALYDLLNSHPEWPEP